VSKLAQTALERRILKKLGLSSNAELVRYAVSHCLVD